MPLKSLSFPWCLLFCESIQGRTMISANKYTFSHLALQHFIRHNSKIWCSFDIMQTAFSGSLLLSPACFIFHCSANLHIKLMFSCKNEVYVGYARIQKVAGLSLPGPFWRIWPHFSG